MKLRNRHKELIILTVLDLDIFTLHTRQILDKHLTKNTNSMIDMNHKISRFDLKK